MHQAVRSASQHWRSSRLAKRWVIKDVERGHAPCSSRRTRQKHPQTPRGDIPSDNHRTSRAIKRPRAVQEPPHVAAVGHGTRAPNSPAASRGDSFMQMTGRSPAKRVQPARNHAPHRTGPTDRCVTQFDPTLLLAGCTSRMRPCRSLAEADVSACS
jgi:hypothetical protein